MELHTIKLDAISGKGSGTTTLAGSLAWFAISVDLVALPGSWC